ncbi:glycoside hydrolase [Saccharibacillus sp. CPCC 101409]|uniref:glycoside hydrolase family 38 N-terminal domain-containing protein n=1 Tax=Saccharibacillus sp. CPCC 101409 TaxID=3058041 RepID=UPI00267261BE|nr:glycoside hydrolase [Saccharibacillus sp. CPCC 101409]MDO3412520.1 glycoside hydrolase [Saccharibacillus sp. CPCC 101409]
MQTGRSKWKIYVIHHSHTDIGYTERQEKIEQYHVDFIRQAVAICEASRTEEHPEWEGFKWTCETFWAVEQFLKGATDAEKKRFEDALRRGDIELSGTYLNMTELAGYELLREMASRAGKFAELLGLKVRSAMTADVNGYSWGYSQALADAGIENLLSSIHTHHGMYAIGRKQFPFYWETPGGSRLLVWSGEHYMMGNDLGINLDGMLSYTIRDENYVWGIAEDHWTMAETRIARYLEQLDKEGYPYDFVLVNVMGLLRDNAAPNGRVMSFIKEWNAKHGDTVEIEMTTLNRYFDMLRQQDVEIPVYKGDWPDWWSDGVASTAMHTQIFRGAQRTLSLVKRLDADRGSIAPEEIKEAEQQLMMYAEHTWGYHSSISEPWHPMVQELAVRKEAYAAGASRLAYRALDKVLEGRGDALLRAGRDFTYKVLNSFDYPVKDLAFFYLEEQWEADYFRGGLEVVEERTGQIVPHQQERVSRGYQIAIVAELEAGEEKSYTIRGASKPAAGRTTSSTCLIGADRVHDIRDLIAPVEDESGNGIFVTANGIESEHVRIAWRRGEGIVSWIDKRTSREMIDFGQEHGAFTPVYEVTQPEHGDQMTVRRIMGRNRKGMNVRRSAGTLVGVKEIANGSLYAVVELTYLTEGMSHYSLFLKVFGGQPRVDAAVRMHKNSVWEPENVYISLPFAAGDGGRLWLDKAGAGVRPGIDQIPGTLTDFYCIQDGLALVGEGGGLALATPDTPLIQTGPLEFGQRKVHGQQTEEERPSLYAWALTNYWETNFKATLGGFYEFRYTLQWGEEFGEAESAFRANRSVNTGTVAFRSL